MAKKVKKSKNELSVDRLLLVAVLSAATSYIVKGEAPWMAMFFGAAAIVLGVLWSARAIMTNPSREFRLLATLVLVLLTSLVAFFLAGSQGLL
jgi:uncharacterized membrane protein YfcA